jgi:hypothetical protein
VPASKAEQVLDALKALLETVAAPLFWLDVSHEVTTRYSYDGAKVVPRKHPPSRRCVCWRSSGSSMGRRNGD